jgi:type IV pilus assembly protein PilP
MKAIFLLPVLALLPVVCEATRIQGALEKFELKQLSVESISELTCEGQRRAYIYGPDYTVYLVQPGDYIGSSDGRITEITADSILLTELVSDGKGGWLERPTSLRWVKPQEE